MRARAGMLVALALSAWLGSASPSLPAAVLGAEGDAAPAERSQAPGAPPADVVRDYWNNLIAALGVMRWGPNPLHPDAQGQTLGYQANPEGRPVRALSEQFVLHVGDRFTATWFVGLREYTRTEELRDTADGEAWVTVRFAWEVYSEAEYRDYLEGLLDEPEPGELDRLVEEARRLTTDHPFDLNHPDAIPGPRDSI